MSKKKKPSVLQINGRRITRHEARIYELTERSSRCLYERIESLILVPCPTTTRVRRALDCQCRNIEQQFIKLRDLLCMTKSDFQQRQGVTEKFLDCLLRHHNTIYEGLIFGSSINGMGFKDSDVDLRLRPVKLVDDDTLEPVEYSRAEVESALKNIAYQTTKCSPVSGCFAPSNRCPVAKLKFVKIEPSGMEEGMNFDVSMLSSNSLGSFNSKYMRFLCHLEPKFHLLAIALRYWSKTQDLIQPGLLSSYALVTMLIFFCENTSPALLPTVDEMNRAYFREPSIKKLKSRKALIREEWNCLISFKRDSYQRSPNKEPLCLLLLKFFEFYLDFPYSSRTIISTRLGRAIHYDSFRQSPIYDENFPMKELLNIQDPFDLKHNVTSGMKPEFFKRFMLTIRISYEKLFIEVGKFTRPPGVKEPKNGDTDPVNAKKLAKMRACREIWGLNAIMVKIDSKL